MALFCIFTVLVKFVDVRDAGINDTVIGFGGLNLFFRNLTPFNDILYIISEGFGGLMIAVCLIFAVFGLYVLIKEKDITKVDNRLILLGFSYIVVVIIKLFFDKVLIINYRPVSLDFESSFPSSHSFLSCFIFMTGAKMADVLFNRKLYRLGILLSALAVVTRMLSGIHWFTDIAGGVLLASALVCIFYGCCSAMGKVELSEEQKKQEQVK